MTELKILRMPDVTKITGLSKSTIYTLIRNGKFPKSIELTTQSVGWRNCDVMGWLESKVKARGHYDSEKLEQAHKVFKN